MAQVTLKEVIDIVMLQSLDRDSYLYGVDRTIVISYAKRLLQELNYAGLRSIRLVMSEIYASGKVSVPDDFVEYARIFYCVGNYLLPVFHNDTINPLQWEGLKDFEEKIIYTETGKKIYTESEDYLITKSLTHEKVKEYGRIKHLCSMKGYKYDHKNNYFIFDYIPDGITHVAIEYVADPLISEPDPSKLSIHKYFQKALEAGIYSYIIEKRRNVPMNEKMRAKREWNIKYNDALAELNAKPFEYMQYIMGWKHMVKWGYPGLGGQNIPGISGNGNTDVEEVFVEFSAEYTDYVCQKTPPVIKKEVINISATAEREGDLVKIYCTAEKLVGSEVRISCGPGYIILPAGSSTANTVINPEIGAEYIELSIYSVGGMIAVSEDEKYIYKVTDRVKVPPGKIVLAKTTSTNISFKFPGSDSLIVDWGDGHKEQGNSSHTYTDGKDLHEIRIYGKNDFLTSIVMNDSGLTYLDVSGNTNLSGLFCKNNSIDTLIVNGCLNLYSIDAQSNNIREIDLTENVILDSLNMNENSLSSIDISKCTSITNVQLRSNELTGIDTSRNSNLTGLWCDNNKISVLDVTSNFELLYLIFNNNNISDIDLSQNKKLQQVLCIQNLLESIDVSLCPDLNVLWCSYNNISHLDVSNNHKLGDIVCGNNPLTTVDFSHNPMLVNISINEIPGLTELDVSANLALTTLDCDICNIHSLILPSTNTLRIISMEDNNISEIIIPDMSMLDILFIANNPISHDAGKMTVIANQLPDKSGQLAGSISIMDSNVIEVIRPLCEAKNWEIKR